MSLNLLIATDFAPERFAGWHMLNTLLQKKSGLSLHLLTPASTSEQNQLIKDGKVDLMYASPFDSASMVRDNGYQAIIRPIGKSNEIVIAAGADSKYNEVEDLQPGCKIAMTDKKDVKLIGLRLLKPAGLTEDDLEWKEVDTYQAAARVAIAGEVDASFLPDETYESFSKLTKSRLKLLAESKLADITHVLLASPKAAESADAIEKALVGMGSTPDGQPVLDELGLSEGFEVMEKKDMDLMIGLMDTLLD